jgi:hypothetical protein
VIRTSDSVSSEGSSAESAPTGALTRVPSACGTRTASACAVEKKPPCTHEVVRPSRQNSQVLSNQANGAITRSPAFTVLTADPVSSTTPMNSWPIGEPSAEAGIEW